MPFLAGAVREISLALFRAYSGNEGVRVVAKKGTWRTNIKNEIHKKNSGEKT